MLVTLNSERTKSVALFNYGKLCTLVPTITIVKQQDLLFHASSWYHIDWCNFCIHLKSLNVCNNDWSCRIKKYGIEVFNDTTSPLNFKKTYQMVRKLISVGGGAKHRQHCDLISPSFYFEESTLNILVQRSIQWHNVHTKFHKNVSSHSQAIRCTWGMMLPVLTMDHG